MLMCISGVMSPVAESMVNLNFGEELKANDNLETKNKELEKKLDGNDVPR